MKADILRVLDDDNHAVAIEVTGPVLIATTLADQLVADIAKMNAAHGDLKVKFNDAEFTVLYDECQAVGDNGQPVRGDCSGDYELVVNDRVVFRQHVSPHGTSGYGNSSAKRYGAERVAEAIAQQARSHA